MIDGSGNVPEVKKNPFQAIACRVQRQIGVSGYYGLVID